MQGFRTRGHVNRTTPSDQVHPTSLFGDRSVEGFQLQALPVVVGMEIVRSICLLSLLLMVQETTQEEVVVNPTTRSDQAQLASLFDGM